MKAWLRQHRFAMFDAWSRVRGSAGSFSFNALVMAIALALPFAGLTILENLAPVSARLAVEPELSIFLAADAPRARATALLPGIRRILQAHQADGRIEFVPRENALEGLKGRTGMSEAIATLGSNPLPDSYVIKLAGYDNAAAAARVDVIAAELKGLPGVEFVQVDSAWVKRLAALSSVLRIAFLLLAAMLSVVVVAVVFNTIRLQVLTQLEEIEISRLVGATDSFIYRPFLYNGALLGLFAGAIALAGVALLLQPMNAAVTEFARLYGSSFRLSPLGPGASLMLLAISALLGWCGALLSTRRHLARAA
jgi:cell division transport system permease protein